MSKESEPKSVFVGIGSHILIDSTLGHVILSSESESYSDALGVRNI